MVVARVNHQEAVEVEEEVRQILAEEVAAEEGEEAWRVRDVSSVLVLFCRSMSVKMALRQWEAVRRWEQELDGPSITERTVAVYKKIRSSLFERADLGYAPT